MLLGYSKIKVMSDKTKIMCFETRMTELLKENRTIYPNQVFRNSFLKITAKRVF